MRRRMMKSKIHRATVTDANLHYVGSITLDTELMAPADIRECEQVHVRRHRQRRPLRDLRHPGRARRRLPQRRRRPPGAARRPHHRHHLRRLRGRRARRLRARASCTSTPPTGRSTRPRPRRWPRPPRPARSATSRSGRRREMATPRRRARRALTDAPDRSTSPSARRWPPSDRSTCSCWAAASPACRPRCAPPSTHGMRVGRAHQGRAAARPPPAGPRAAWPRCCAGDPDSTDLHLADTLAAGAGLCDVDAVRVLVDEGPRPGQRADRARRHVRPRRPRASSSWPARAATAMARIVHAGGAATGAEIERALVDAVRRTAAALHEHTFALDLIVEDGRCVGVSRARTPTACATRCGPATCCSPPAAPASCSRSPPTRSRPPATASPWRCGPAWRWPTSSSSSSTRPRCTTRACPGRCCPRRCAATARCCATPTASGSSTSCCPATWCRGPMTRRDARAGRRPRAGSTPPASSTSTQRFPTIAADAAPRPASTRRPTGCPSRPPPTTCAAASSPTSTAPSSLPGPVGRGRGDVLRRARRQPAGLQLAARGHGVRPPGRSRPSPPGVDGPEPTGAMRAVLGARTRDDPDDRARRWRRRLDAARRSTPTVGRRRRRRATVAELRRACSGP